MLPSLTYWPAFTARYRTLDECYKTYSVAKAEALKRCFDLSRELENAFKPEFSPVVNAGISSCNCMTFSFTSDIYVPLPIYSPPDTTAHENVLVCRMHVTKAHVEYDFSHELYRMPTDVLLRLFDICPYDCSFYYSRDLQAAMRREAGVLA